MIEIGARHLSVTMQLKRPLTLALSPWYGAREWLWLFCASTPFGEGAAAQVAFTLPPSDGERAGVRGISNRIVTDLCRFTKRIWKSDRMHDRCTRRNRDTIADIRTG